MSELFDQPLRVLNVGVRSFADSITRANAPVVHVEWRPPAGGQIAAGHAVAQLIKDPRVEHANETAFAAFLQAQPVLEDVRPAHELIPDLAGRLLLHAGPPVAWERMCGPMQGAIIGAILLEGWANTPDEATSLAASGKSGSRHATTIMPSAQWRASLQFIHAVGSVGMMPAGTTLFPT